MIDVHISQQLREKIPAAVLGCIQCCVRVEKSPAELLGEIDVFVQRAQEKLKLEDIITQTHIADTRIGYKALGKDPHRYRNSCEAMMRRVLQGKGLYHINNVVEVNNLVSLTSGFSLGTYDAQKLSPPIFWAPAPQGSHYQGIGKDQINTEFLPALFDEEGAFGTPTSDSVKAMITPETREILLCVYSFSGEDGLASAIRQAKELLERYCNARNIQERIIK